MKTNILLVIILIMSLLPGGRSFSQGLPPGWDYVPTPTTHIISIPLTANPNINGYPLKPGDWIGVFYNNNSGGQSCGGAIEWTGTQNTGIIAFGDDSFTPVKDGFSNNEPIIYRVYSWGVQNVYSATVTCNNSLPSTCSNFTANGLSGLASLNAAGFYFVLQASATSICQGTSVQLTATPSGGSGNYTYNWTSSPAGFTSNISNPSVSPSATTTYFCQVTNAGNSLTSNISIEVASAPLVNAGNDLSICAGQTASLSGNAQNATAYSWTTTGNGTFSNPNTLNPIYTPGTNDISSGSVQLCLSATGSALCPTFTDCLVLTINPLPIVTLASFPSVCAGDPTFPLTGGLPAGGIYYVNGVAMVNFNPVTPGTYNVVYQYTAPNGCANSANQQILVKPLPTVTCPQGFTVCCSSNPIPLNNATPVGGNYSGQGVVDNVFYPSCTSIGSFPITYTYTSPSTGCQNTCQFVITVAPLPVVSCPSSIQVCINTPAFSLTGATPPNGTFIGPGVVNNTFTPIQAGVGIHQIFYSFTDGNGCTNSCAFSIEVKPLPSVNAGFPQVFIVLPNTVVFLNDATAINQNSVSWTSSGTGTFSNPNLVNPEYTLSEGDIQSGFVTLTLTGANDCGNSSDDIVVIVNECQPAIADAGDDATICENQNFQVIDASAQLFESLLWSNNGGDGTFDDPTVINPVYFPGLSDIQSGSVVLSLTAYPLELCDTVTDYKTLTIVKLPVCNSGADQSICQNEILTVAGTAGNFSTTLWSTNGDGYFQNPSNLQTFYYPGITDINNGTVTLSLTALPVSPCIGSIVDQLFVTIIKHPNAQAGEDATIPAGQSLQLDATASNFLIILWSTSGDGFFSAYDVLNPIYTPGQTDLQNAGAVLTLSAFPISPCTNLASDDVILTIDTLTSINTTVDNRAIRIFPNPVSEYLFINAIGFSHSKMQVEVFNQNGYVVLKKDYLVNLPDESILEHIDTKNFPAGLYLIRVKIDDTTFIEKVLVLRY